MTAFLYQRSLMDIAAVPRQPRLLVLTASGVPPPREMKGGARSRADPYIGRKRESLSGVKNTQMSSELGNQLPTFASKAGNAAAMLQEAVSFVPVSGLFAFATCDVSDWDNHVAPRHQQRAVCTCLHGKSYEKNQHLRNSHSPGYSSGWTMASTRTARSISRCAGDSCRTSIGAIGRLLMSWQMRRSIVSAERSSRPAAHSPHPQP